MIASRPPLTCSATKRGRTHDSIRARSRLRACRSSFVGGSRHVWNFLSRLRGDRISRRRYSPWPAGLLWLARVSWTRGGGGPDALVDGQGLAQERDALVVVAVLEMAVTGSFQGARLFQWCADLAGDGQCLAVVMAGLAGGRGPGR